MITIFCGYWLHSYNFDISCCETVYKLYSCSGIKYTSVCAINLPWMSEPKFYVHHPNVPSPLKHVICVNNTWKLISYLTENKS